MQPCQLRMAQHGKAAEDDENDESQVQQQDSIGEEAVVLPYFDLCPYSVQHAPLVAVEVVQHFQPFQMIGVREYC